MRLFMIFTVLLFVVLTVSDGVSAQKSGRGQSGKKQRSSGSGETHYDEKDNAADHHEKNQYVKNHDNSRNRKRRSVNEAYLESLISKDTSRNDRQSEESAEKLPKKSRSTEKREISKNKDKNYRCKESSKNIDTGKSKQKSESRAQKKSRNCDNEEKNYQNTAEVSSEFADENDTIENHKNFDKDPSDSSDCLDDEVQKLSSSQSESKSDYAKRKKYNVEDQEISTGEKGNDDEKKEPEAESEVGEKWKRTNIQSNKSVCEKNKKCNKERKREKINSSKDQEEADNKWKKKSDCTMKRHCKDSAKKSSIKSKNDVSSCDCSSRENKKSSDIIETTESDEDEEYREDEID